MRLEGIEAREAPAMVRVYNPQVQVWKLAAARRVPRRAATLSEACSVLHQPCPWYCREARH